MKAHTAVLEHGIDEADSLHAAQHHVYTAPLNHRPARVPGPGTEHWNCQGAGASETTASIALSGLTVTMGRPRFGSFENVRSGQSR
jgi:hypothetical protein